MKAKQRRTTSKGPDVAELKANVDSLIRENTRLKRQLAKLQDGRAKSTLPNLTRINNRVRKALTDTTKAIRGRGKNPTAAKRTITDPVLLEKRRAALAKARAARAANKAAAGSS